MPDTRLRSLTALRDAQAALIDEVTGESHSRVLVHAPTGSGKTTAALIAANSLRGRNPAARIAFLVSHRVMSQPTRTRLDGPSVDISAKSDFLTADARVSGTNVVIAQPSLSSIDVQTLLFGTDWDLVVVDEADNLNATGVATLRRLAESSQVHRLLILSRGFLDLPDPQLAELPLTHVVLWHMALEDLSKIGDQPLKVHYVRSQAEVDLFDRVGAALTDLPSILDVDTVERLRIAQESTLFALQAELLGIVDVLRKRRNSLAHSTTGDADSAVAPREFAVIDRAIPEFEAIVDDIDRVQVDSKVEALKQVLKDLYEKGSGPIAVFVQPEASARYLGSALGEVAPISLTLPAAPLAPRVLIDQTVQNLGVVVLSDEALSAYDLRPMTVGVHFDYSVSPEMVGERESRIGAIDQRGRLLFIALVPAD